MPIRISLPFVALMLLAGCGGASGRPEVRADAPVFRPIAFFTGPTRGEGRLKVILSRGRAVHVEGMGRVGADGALTLVQQVAEEGKPARTRSWILRPAGGGYTASLTDATGPVTVTVDRNLLHLAFDAKGGLHIEQWLALRPDGRTAQNRLEVRKFGVRVAVLDETIRKTGS